MNEWLEFLKAQGATWQNQKLQDFAKLSGSAPAYLIPMLNHRLLQAQGIDAAKFLQGQCTCDIRELEQHKVLLGAHCNRQGRMLSSFAVTELLEHTIGLRTRSDIAAATLASLKRYIVFAKATLDLSPWLGLALIGGEAKNLPVADIPPPGQSSVGQRMVVLHHLSGLIEIWADIDRAQDLWRTLLPVCQPAPPTLLDQFLISHGLAEVQAATQENYLPQDFNYQAIQAINFKKGCYTGQEIVARMQYRGQLKKHCYRMVTDSVEGSVGLATALHAPNGDGKQLAEVVASSAGQILVVTTEEIAAANPTLIHAETQIKFTWAELPYAIP